MSPQEDDFDYWMRRLNRSLDRAIMGLANIQARPMPRKTIYLICGYAQSGKDTLADAIIRELGGEERCSKTSFADSLKNAAGLAFQFLGLTQVNFHREEWKKKHRKVLVALAEAAREEDPEIFAKAACVDLGRQFSGYGRSVVVPDWRYVNELDVLEEKFSAARIVRIRMIRKGWQAGAPQEKDSVDSIFRDRPLDFIGEFDDGDNEGIALFAKSIVESVPQESADDFE